MRFVRGLIAGLLLSAGLALVPLGDVAIWARRALFDTTQFSRIATSVVEQPDVRRALADRIADDLIERQPSLAPARLPLATASRTALASPAFRAIFQGAVAQLHRQLVDGDPRLTLDLRALLPLVRDAIARADPAVAALVPSTGLDAIKVASKHDAPALWHGIDAARTASWAIPLLALVLIIGAILVSSNRLRVTITAGLGVAAFAIIMLIVLRLAHGAIVDNSGSTLDRDAFDAGWHTVTDTLVSQTILLGLGGLVVAAGAFGTNLIRRAT